MHDGDWRCACGFFPNFGRRNRCFDCGKPRVDRRTAEPNRGGGLAANSVGANGLRPQATTGTAARAEPPSYRVPGASLAAKATYAAVAATRPRANGDPANHGEEVRGQRPRQAEIGGGGRPAGGAGAAAMDAEGFRAGQRRGAKRQSATAAKTGGGGGDGDRGHGSGAGDTHETEEDDDMDAGADVDDDAGGEDGQHVEHLDAGELRRRWREEIAFVKRLAKQGVEAEHPAMLAACATRDTAERLWRQRKEPAPLATRLGWAQRKFDRAVELLSSTRAKIMDLERELRERKAVLVEQLEADKERVTKRRGELEDLQEEAGAESSRPRGHGGEVAIRRACGTLREKVAPALATLAEQLESGSSAWETVQQLMGTLSEQHENLQKAAEAGDAQQYDIGDGEDGLSEWSESHDLREDHWQSAQCGTEMAEAHQWQHWAQAQGYASASAGCGSPASGAAASQQQDPSLDDHMGDASWHGWGHAGWAAAARWQECGHGKWARTSWADAWEQERRAESAYAIDEPHRKNRRLEDAGTDACAESAGAREQETEDPAKVHAERLEIIVKAAVDAGIQPVTAHGEDLHLLDSDELATWAHENLPAW